MAIEEERKWREYEADVLGGEEAQPAAVGAALTSPAVSAASMVPPSPAGMGAAPAEIEVEVPRNAAELSEATEWLKVPRKLWLRERNSESDMVFAVVGEDADVGAHQLQWSLPSTPREIEGFVSLADIGTVKAVPSDPTCFSLVLRSHNPQAVRNSGGLHAVNVRCSSPSECAMYRSGLLGLHSLVQ